MNTPEEHKVAADRFGGVAREFCAVVDEAQSVDRTDLLLRIYRILPNLIAEAIRLPNISADESDESDEPISRPSVSVDMSQIRATYNFLKEKFADWDLYIQVFDPINDKEAIHGTLSDDVADIYRDLSEGILLLKTYPKQPGEAIWEWRFSYYSHWGQHALNALYTIHFRLQDVLE